jgi:hypothetical protein
VSTWKPASAVFPGGTQQIEKLVGARVRTQMRLLSVSLYDPVHGRKDTIDLPIGAVGFVANPHPEMLDMLLIAFPLHVGALPTSLSELQRTGNFRVVVVNAPTFKHRFEVER